MPRFVENCFWPDETQPLILTSCSWLHGSCFLEYFFSTFLPFTWALEMRNTYTPSDRTFLYFWNCWGCESILLQFYQKALHINFYLTLPLLSSIIILICNNRRYGMPSWIWTINSPMVKEKWQARCYTLGVSQPYWRNSSPPSQ